MDTKPNIHFATVEVLRSLAHKLYRQGAIGDAQTLAIAITEVVQATGDPGFYADTFLGGCPHCGDSEEVLQLGRKRYAVCHEHRVYWYIGAHLWPAGVDAAQNAHPLPGLLASYSEISIAEAFPQQACPCCGLSVEHTLWCIMPGPRRP